MKTKIWIVISLMLAISCTNDESDSGRTASFKATIETFAGSSCGYEGDGGDAKDAQLCWITGLAIDASGSIYVSDGSSNTIRKINSANIISTVAGVFVGFNVIDPLHYSGDGGPAEDAHLNIPQAVAIDALGNIFISDAANSVLRKIDASGTISTLTGKANEYGYEGHNVPASQAVINNPNGIAADSDGNVYFVDSQNHVIRKISVDGVITTIAGTPGEAGYTGDGGLAINAKLNMPQGIAIDENDNLYISDNNAAIRKISEGEITTIAGTGVEGFSGDGGLATEARLQAPKGIAVMDDGSIVFADSGCRIRRIAADTGLIETIAGTGVAGYSGDGGPAIDAQLSDPLGLAVDAAGNIYVAESGNGVIRIIKPVK